MWELRLCKHDLLLSNWQHVRIVFVVAHWLIPVELLAFMHLDLVLIEHV